MAKAKHNKGYTLVWVVMLLSLLAVLTVAALAIGQAYTKRSSTQNYQHQAYYTALSAVDTVAALLSGQDIANTESTQALLERLDKAPAVAIPDMGFPDEMGRCSVLVRKVDKTHLTITATAQYAGQSYTITGSMTGEESEQSYGKPGTPGIGAGGGMIGGGTDADTDIYISEKGTTSIGKKVSEFDNIMMGSFYTMGSLNFEGGFSEYLTSHIHGEIVADGDVNISGQASVGAIPRPLSVAQREHSSYCKNEKASGIYSMQQVSMTGSARVAGDIVATSFQLGSRAAVEGTVRAKSILVNGSERILPPTPTMRGTLTGNDVTISGKSEVTGDIVADVLTLKGNVTITGNITARSIRVDTTGTVKVTGDILCSTLTKNGKFVHTGTLVKDSSMAWTLPVTETLESKVPPKKPTAPEVPIPEDAEPIMSVGTTPVLDNSKPVNYYKISSSKAYGSLRLLHENPTIIYVEPGVATSISYLRTNDVSPKPPFVYFILGNQSTLSLGVINNPVRAYVWNEVGATSTVLELGYGTEFWGGLSVDAIFSSGNCTYHWVPPDLSWLYGGGGGGGAGGGGSTLDTTWTLTHYDNK
ncbi:MAG: polymer-forming cytoskeletal protein [Angelakisella sp.]